MLVSIVCFRPLFWDGENFFGMIWTVYFTVIPRYNYRHDVKLDARNFLLYSRGINRRYVRKSTWVLFLESSVCYKFHNDKWKNHYSLQRCSIIALLGKLLLIFKNSNAIASYLIFSWKLKEVEEFSAIC